MFCVNILKMTNVIALIGALICSIFGINVGCFAIWEILKKKKKLEFGYSEARFGISVKNDAERCSR